jgi:hypothetical protein
MVSIGLAIKLGSDRHAVPTLGLIPEAAKKYPNPGREVAFSMANYPRVVHKNTSVKKH